MYNLIMQTIAWFAISCSVVSFIVYIILYIKNKKNQDDWLSLTRDTYLSNTDFRSWYIIPTISVSKLTNYLEIDIIFLKWVYVIEYHIKDSAEDDAIADAKYKSKHENEL